MARLFIFAIGGTGSRVLRSLTMLMACGVRMECEEVVPIIIDPDQANGNLTDTVGLLNKYIAVRSSLSFQDNNKSDFFRTDLTQTLPNFTLQILKTNNMAFGDFIGLNTMSGPNQAMMRMLYSDSNLDADLKHGFTGNPNMGSVVLNQITSGKSLEDFANSFAQGDRIFIISSIFGGTGASGFPLLVKTLRTNTTLPNAALLNTAPIGALTILPYFKVKPDGKSRIDSDTFISKAKAALAYYDENITQQNYLESFYFLGDDAMQAAYDNSDGGVKQTNPAHLIEFLSATAIVDFANTNFPPVAKRQTVYRELGIDDPGTGNAINFHHLFPALHNMLYRPMVSFTMMVNALFDQRSLMESDKLAANAAFPNFYSSDFYQALRAFMEEYGQWMEELKANSPSLDLVDLHCGGTPFNLLPDVKKPRRVASLLSNYDLLMSRLNAAERHLGVKDKPTRFMEMYAQGCDKMIDEKF